MPIDELGLVEPLKPFGIDAVDLDMLRRGDKLDKAGAKFYAAIERLLAERDEEAARYAEQAESSGNLVANAFSEIIAEIEARASAAEARQLKLEEALQPFADAADELPDHIHDLVPVVLTTDEDDNPATIVHIGDFSRARQALKDTPS